MVGICIIGAYCSFSWTCCGLQQECHHLFIEGVQALTHCVLSHKFKEVIWETGNSSGLIPQMSHDPCEQSLPLCLSLPHYPLQCPGLSLRAGHEGLFNNSHQVLLMLHAAGLLFAPLCCLIFYFGSGSSAETPGKASKPLIEGRCEDLVTIWGLEFHRIPL